MRKLIAVGAACAAALGAVTTAQAGVEAQDSTGNGNFIVLDADFAPPTNRSRSVKVSSISYNVSFGNKRTGSPFPQTERLSLGLPKGTKYNAAKFPKCEGTFETQVQCDEDEQVGGGGAVIDARNLGVQEPVIATVEAFNGPLREGNPTLVLVAKGTVNGSPIEAQINFVYTRGALELFYSTDSRIAYSFSSFNLELGAAFKSKTPGNKAVTTSLINAPKTCPSRGFAFTLLHQDPAGTTIAASDRQPCIKVKG